MASHCLEEMLRHPRLPIESTRFSRIIHAEMENRKTLGKKILRK